MDIQNVVKQKSKMAFVLADATPAYANALRRAIIALVPSMAIEDVTIAENSSALYDEVIAHRLGLLPMVTDLESYQLPSLFPDDGVSRAACEVKMSLEAKGPCTVYASEIKSKDPKVKCALPNMPIVKLLKGQSLKVEMTAVLGQGKDHMKWAPATAHYLYQPIVVEGGKSTPVQPKDLIEEKTFEVFVKPNGSLNLPVTKGKNPTVTESKTDFVFVVESFGQLKPEAIVAEAFNQLSTQADNVLDALKAIE